MGFRGAVWAAAVLVFCQVGMAFAQGGSDNAGSLPVLVGQTSSTQSATLIFTTATTAGTPFTINVLTQGAPGLDFNLVTGGTCSTTATYGVGATCTVLYRFSPKHPGTRYGGISLTVGTTVLANTYISGLGLGPQVTFLPATQIQLGSIAFGDDIAVDGNGNLFVPDFFGALYEIPKGCTNANCVVTMGGYGVTAVAVDGSGNLFAASYTTGLNPIPLVAMFPRGCLSASCAVAVGGGGTGLSEPEGIAVDGSGDVYLSTGKPGTTDMMLVEFPAGCNSASCMVTLLDGIPNTGALAVDVSGNLYFAENSVVYQLPPNCRSASCLFVVGGGFNRPDGFAIDSVGRLFVSDGVKNAIYKVPMGCTTASCTLMVASGSGFPFGIAVDGSGNLYVNDDHDPDTVYELDVSDPPTVTFPATIQGRVSAAQTVTLTDEGNEPLVFVPSTVQPDPVVSQYFSLDTTDAGTCGLLINSSTTPSLPAYASCTLPLSFAPLPPAIGTVNGTLTVQDNNLNVVAATQTVPLVGTAIDPIATLMLMAMPNPAVYGTSVTLTCAAGTNSPGVVPTGTVTFLENGVALATEPIGTGGTGYATTVYATTALPAGSDALTCSYSGDGNYGGVVSAPVPEVVSDFSLVVTPPTQTVNPGDAATYTVTLAGVVLAYPSAVTLSATGLPPGATVSFGYSVLVPGAGPTSTTMTVQTAANQAGMRGVPGIVYGMLLLPLLGLRRLRRRLRGVVCCAAAMLCMGAFGGCSGGYFAPPQQSFMITLTAVSGGLSHAVPVGLTVR